ncbi:hypothetical protein BV133_1960 [Blastochloris viridis]|uniref:Uncharacterized protein n=1 Tax=Blastochloris viridis TaxID=1079 RepID=A0A182D2Z0_BLAVI|nr:hypothetical protein BV133_1960 [Blastochloris viridis]
MRAVRAKLRPRFHRLSRLRAQVVGLNSRGRPARIVPGGRTLVWGRAVPGCPHEYFSRLLEFRDTKPAVDSRQGRWRPERQRLPGRDAAGHGRLEPRSVDRHFGVCQRGQ